MLSKSLIQFFVDKWGCVPSLLFDLRPNCGGGNEYNGDLLQKVPCRHCCTQCPQPCSRPLPTHASTGHSWASLGQSLVGSLLLSPGSWCTRFCLCPPRVYFPVLCTLWQLYDGVSGDLLQEGLCHIQVCCTQSPCPCGVEQSTADLYLHRRWSDTVLSQSLWVPGSRCAQGLFEPSEHLWWE